MSYLVNDVFPAGIVLPYAGSTAPAGWLLCDGTSYIRNDYLRLFNAIGTAHGSLAGNAFNVPDYRGRFLRGTDNMGSGAAGRDPNTATRTIANVGGNTGNNVGSVQTNATAVNGLSGSVNKNSWNTDQVSHSHAQQQALQGVGNSGGSAQTGVSAADVDNVGNINYLQATTGNGSASWNSASVGVAFSADSETRPLNAYVNYIIKI